MASRTRFALSVPVQSGSAEDSVGEQRGLLKYLSYIDAKHKISNFRFWHAAGKLTKPRSAASEKRTLTSIPIQANLKSFNNYKVLTCDY